MIEIVGENQPKYGTIAKKIIEEINRNNISSFAELVESVIEHFTSDILLYLMEYTIFFDTYITSRKNNPKSFS